MAVATSVGIGVFVPNSCAETPGASGMHNDRSASVSTANPFIDMIKLAPSSYLRFRPLAAQLTPL
jgi:hypothetical protein